MTKREIFYIVLYYIIVVAFIINIKFDIYVEDSLAYAIEMFGIAIPLLSMGLGVLLGGKIWRWFVPFGTGATEMITMWIVNEMVDGNFLVYFFIGFVPAFAGVLVGMIVAGFRIRKERKKQRDREYEEYLQYRMFDEK